MKCLQSLATAHGGPWQYSSCVWDSVGEKARQDRNISMKLVYCGGEGGIRTPDTVARMPHFECGAFNHSATSPGLDFVHTFQVALDDQ